MKSSLIISLMAGILVLPVLADLKAYPNSGGINMPNFIDSKAEPVIGVGTSPDGKTKAELGGIYTLGPAGPDEKPPLYDFTEHGSVILDISKVGDQIVVKWKVNTNDWPELAGQLIDVYCMKGNGDGSYVLGYDNNFWVKVVDKDKEVNPPPLVHPINIVPAGYKVSIFAFQNDPNVWHGEIRVAQQVGNANGQKEIYFKAKLSDPLLEGMGSFSKIASVGKVDYALTKGYNFISFPFVYEGEAAKISQIIGNQLDMGDVQTGDRVYIKDTSTSWGMPNIYLDAQGIWRWTNNSQVADISLENQRGYLIRRQQDNTKYLTLTGKLAQKASITMGNSFNAIGAGIPLVYDLAVNDLGLFGLPNVTAGNAQTADRLYLKQNSGSWGMPNVYLDSLGKWRWSNNDQVVAQNEFKFGIPRGYFYRMKGQGNITWIRKIN